jgi:glycosyltransferase involved in cell wall biosynthesis
MRAVAIAAARVLGEEDAVVASWGSAGPVFQRMRDGRGGLCVLSFPTVHPRYYRKLLREEAVREPAFAETLINHEWPHWMEEQFEHEISMAHRVFVGSSFARNSFVAEGIPAERLDVIPYGADLDLFYPAELTEERPNGALRLLFVGRLDQAKGIAYLMKAYERFRGPETHLTLVGRMAGNGTAFRPYRGLFNHVGHVPRPSLAHIYRQADVFVLPTLLEGMPLVVLEAMASGLPVITTTNGAGDIVRHNVDGFVVPTRDVDAIVDGLERLRRDPSLRAQMGRNARQRAQQFTWKAYRHMAVRRLRQLLTITHEKETPNEVPA